MGLEVEAGERAGKEEGDGEVEVKAMVVKAFIKAEGYKTEEIYSRIPYFYTSQAPLFLFSLCLLSLATTFLLLFHARLVSPLCS
jgi:hypothetical protein